MNGLKELAEACGFTKTHTGEVQLWLCNVGDLERFAKLVAAKEREACAKIAETPVGEYEVIVACGSEPAPHRIPRYLDSMGVAKAIRARS